MAINIRRRNRQPAYFEDRKDAGRKLSTLLRRFSRQHPHILALPRGGVVLGSEIAKELNAPLDIVVTRKIGIPGNPELGIGAISEGGVLILDRKMMEYFNISENDLADQIKAEKKELRRRLFLYRRDRPLPSLKGQSVLMIDDGMATGVTAEASIQAVKQLAPKRIVFGVPVCAYEMIDRISALVDTFICLSAPTELEAIGLYYHHFEQVTDDEVIGLLERTKYQRHHGGYHHA